MQLSTVKRQLRLLRRAYCSTDGLLPQTGRQHNRGINRSALRIRNITRGYNNTLEWGDTLGWDNSSLFQGSLGSPVVSFTPNGAKTISMEADFAFLRTYVRCSREIAFLK